jgi:hypothetical protein
MPYEGPQRKMEWEQHRSQRLDRRREVRQIEAAWKEVHPEASKAEVSGAFCASSRASIAKQRCELIRRFHLTFSTVFPRITFT